VKDQELAGSFTSKDYDMLKIKSGRTTGTRRSGMKAFKAIFAMALMLPLLSLAPAKSAVNQIKAHPFLLEMASTQPASTVGVVVMKADTSTRAETLVRNLGGKVTQEMGLINAFAAELPAGNVAALSQPRYVNWVSYDAPVEPSTLHQVKTPSCVEAECVDTTRLRQSYTLAVDADKVWNTAPYRHGEGVAVAVIDSGIAAHVDFSEEFDGTGDPRIAASVRFNSSTSAWEDYYGHGTHVAGIIGGNGYESKGRYTGVAPKVQLVNLKVGDDEGHAKLSDVVAALQWIYDHHVEFNIRVINLSLGTTIAEPYHLSPLDAALEVLWYKRVVVVVSAGNSPGAINYAPANDPFVITVGAMDHKRTASPDDDVMAPFSAYGTTESGYAKPELVAPGVDIVSLVPSTSPQLFMEHPANKETDPDNGKDYFRMSGTSMSAPVVVGVVALLLQDEPDLTSDQVKYRLMSTARPLEGAGTGAGVVNAYAAVTGTSTEAANMGVPASEMVTDGTGPADWESVNWNSVNWNSVNWNSVNWNSVNWRNDYWGYTTELQFSDLPAGSPFYVYGACLAGRGVISGYSDGTFRPNSEITRGQLAKMVALAAGFNEAVSGQTFPDVAPDSPFYVYVERLVQRSIIGGYGDGTFRPNVPVTRGQLAKIVSKAVGVEASTGPQMFADVAPGHPFYSWVQDLASAGVMSGYACGSAAGEPCGSGNLPYFRPGNSATRGQTAKIVTNAFFPYCVRTP
jgi:serine protease AprX